jgi:hypothetical protein
VRKASIGSPRKRQIRINYRPKVLDGILFAQSSDRPSSRRFSLKFLKATADSRD